MKVNSDENIVIALLQSSVIAPAYPLISLFHSLELACVVMVATAQVAVMVPGKEKLRQHPLNIHLHTENKTY